MPYTKTCNDPKWVKGFLGMDFVALYKARCRCDFINDIRHLFILH